MNIKYIFEFYFDSTAIGHVLMKLYIEESCKMVLLFLSLTQFRVLIFEKSVPFHFYMTY